MRSGVVIIPDVPQGLAASHTELLIKMKQALEVLQGSQLKPKVERRAATFQDLVDLGLITQDRGQFNIPVITWIEVTSFLNSWVNFGAPHNNAAYCKDVMGFVHLRGYLVSGTVSTESFVLPLGYRPVKNEYQHGAHGRIDILPDGKVMMYVPTSYASIDGITFYVGE
jgi:hypothetical protein